MNKINCTVWRKGKLKACSFLKTYTETRDYDKQRSIDSGGIEVVTFGFWVNIGVTSFSSYLEKGKKYKIKIYKDGKKIRTWKRAILENVSHCDGITEYGFYIKKERKD